MWQKISLAWFYGSVTVYFSIISRLLEVHAVLINLAVLFVNVVVDDTARYRSEINKSRPQIRAIFD